MTLTADPSHRTSHHAHALTIDAVREAAAAVHAALHPTPLAEVPGLGVWLKRDDVLPTRAFKVRGGVHLAATATATERRDGLVTASTGNHAQSVAWAARAIGAPATVVVPLGAPRVKVDAVRALGATVVEHGATLSESAAHARTLPGVFVDPTDPRIVLGHATASTSTPSTCRSAAGPAPPAPASSATH